MATSYFSQFLTNLTNNSLVLQNTIINAINDGLNTLVVDTNELATKAFQTNRINARARLNTNVDSIYNNGFNAAKYEWRRCVDTNVSNCINALETMYGNTITHHSNPTNILSTIRTHLLDGLLPQLQPLMDANGLSIGISEGLYNAYFELYDEFVLGYTRKLYETYTDDIINCFDTLILPNDIFVSQCTAIQNEIVSRIMTSVQAYKDSELYKMVDVKRNFKATIEAIQPMFDSIMREVYDTILVAKDDVIQPKLSDLQTQLRRKFEELETTLPNLLVSQNADFVRAANNSYSTFSTNLSKMFENSSTAMIDWSPFWNSVVLGRTVSPQECVDIFYRYLDKHLTIYERNVSSGGSAGAAFKLNFTPFNTYFLNEYFSETEINNCVSEITTETSNQLTDKCQHISEVINGEIAAHGSTFENYYIVMVKDPNACKIDIDRRCSRMLSEPQRVKKILVGEVPGQCKIVYTDDDYQKYLFCDPKQLAAEITAVTEASNINPPQLAGVSLDDIQNGVELITGEIESLIRPETDAENQILNSLVLDAQKQYLQNTLGQVAGDLSDGEGLCVGCLVKDLKNMKNDFKLIKNDLKNSLKESFDCAKTEMKRGFTDALNRSLNPFKDLLKIGFDKKKKECKDKKSKINSRRLSDAINSNNRVIKNEIKTAIEVNVSSEGVYCELADLTSNIENANNNIDVYTEKCNDITNYVDSAEPETELDNIGDELIEKYDTDMTQSMMTQEQIDTALDKVETAIYNNVMNMVEPAINDIDADFAIAQIDKIIDNLDTSYTQLVNDIDNNANNFVEDITSQYIEDMIEYITETNAETKEICDGIINDIVEEPQTVTEDKIKEEVHEFYIESINTLNELTFEDIERDIENQKNEIIIYINNFLNLIGIFDNNAKAQIESGLDNLASNIIAERNEKLVSVFGSNIYQDNKFSAFDSNVYNVPNNIGNGYDKLLFLKDKYRNTIIPLIVNSGGNIISFRLIIDPETINEREELLDQEAIDSYKNIFAYNSTNSKWWSNLEDILSQASILNMTVVITICDFNDANNPFIKDADALIKYDEPNWFDQVQGSFFKRLSDVTNKYDCKVIYNLGYGCFHNPDDPDNINQVMYPTPSYLRKWIMWLAYECNKTSNMLALTANDNENLYYYNPYCEFKSYDDAVSHVLKNCELLAKDYVDGHYNDSAKIVGWSNKAISEGYSKIITNSDKYSLPIFSMQNLTEKITDDMNIEDPNIMNDIFCKNSREAIRFFKTKNYFNSNGRMTFDENGEVES